ncbi:hypothetical protein TNCV_4005761 [Trichonephila clavipes]|nr:hypothetical protein TNCV_4005761 [Trichonephila clavipes]
MTFIYLFYVSNTRAWLLHHLTSILPVPTDGVLSQVLLDSRTSEQIVTFHSGMAAARADLVSSQTKPVEVYSQKVMSGD